MPSIPEVISNVESHEWMAGQTGVASSTLRTWYTRNTHGYRDLFARHSFRPPLLYAKSAKVQSWIRDHRLPGHKPPA